MRSDWKQQRAAAAAKADACRVALITALLIGAGVLCGYVLHQEQQINNVHHLR